MNNPTYISENALLYATISSYGANGVTMSEIINKCGYSTVIYGLGALMKNGCVIKHKDKIVAIGIRLRSGRYLSHQN